ncbi:MAG: hypothetical protein AAB295_10305, partial [Chloroflexota bacterium]
MLAVAADRSKLRFPALVSPKLDGIRCVKLGGRALSRNLKPIPNAHVRALVEKHLFDGMDGELVLADPTAPFREVSSAVMAREGVPDVRFALFDWIGGPAGAAEPFEIRHERCRAFITELGPEVGGFVDVVPHYRVHHESQLEQMHANFIANGYEGTMIRWVAGPYKFGRSTVNEGYLLKVKDFADEEATVTGWQPLRKNENELTKDELGHAKRSSAAAGLVDLPLLGALEVVTKDGAKFTIGSGFTMAERAALYHVAAEKEHGSGDLFGRSARDDATAVRGG